MADGLTLNPDGTAVLTFNTTQITLRLPNLGEYGDLIDVLDQARFQALELIMQASEERGKIIKKGKITDEGQAAYRTAKDKEKAAREVRVRFIIEASQRLGGATLEPASLPAWAISNDLIDKLLTHWETVPFPGSAQPM